MFSDLDETIRQLLIREVPLDLSEVDVAFAAPDREWSGRLSRPTVNCFLFDVQENRDLRRVEWQTRTGNGVATRERPALRIDASYLVTAWARAPEDEHRLLWRVMVALARYPVLPPDTLRGELVDQTYPVQTSLGQPDGTRTNPADLWQAVENRIRPGVKYVATLALDPRVSYTSPLVLTRVARFDHLNGHAPEELIARASDRTSNTTSNGGAPAPQSGSNSDQEV